MTLINGFLLYMLVNAVAGIILSAYLLDGNNYKENTMDKAKAEKIVAMLQDEGFTARVYDDYSGRGMYGKTTTAVVSNDLSRALAVAGKKGVKRPQWDQLGKGYIIY